MTGITQPALIGGGRTFLEEVCHQGRHRTPLGKRVEAETLKGPRMILLNEPETPSAWPESLK